MTKNFKRSEFACKCCGLDTIDAELVNQLQILRDRIGRPIHVNSGIRCEAHNREVGGKPNSQHLLGKAADIRVAGMRTRELVSHVVEMPAFRGVGTYGTFVHVDIREGRKASWRGN
jgi:uncharacterized protein YcbK (DUF882 family)